VINIRKRREIFVYYCRPRMDDLPLRFTQLTSKENFYSILSLTVLTALPFLLPLLVPRDRFRWLGEGVTQTHTSGFKNAVGAES
jgi:hypothetical protein